jgi:hypothetical protein
MSGKSRYQRPRRKPPVAKLMGPHTTVLVDGVEIDEQLAPLIRILWGLGISTHECCQYKEGPVCPVASVWFKDLDRAEQFLGLLKAGNPKATDWQHIDEYPTSEGFRLTVVLSADVDDPAYDLPINAKYRPDPWQAFTRHIGVEFPADRIAELTAGIGKYLASLGES